MSGICLINSYLLDDDQDFACPFVRAKLANEPGNHVQGVVCGGKRHKLAAGVVDLHTKFFAINGGPNTEPDRYPSAGLALEQRARPFARGKTGHFVMFSRTLDFQQCCYRPRSRSEAREDFPKRQIWLDFGKCCIHIVELVLLQVLADVWSAQEWRRPAGALCRSADNNGALEFAGRTRQAQRWALGTAGATEAG